MSEHMSDATFAKVFSWMIAGMVALTILLIVLAYAVGGEAGSRISDVVIKAADEAAMSRTMPAGEMAIGEVAALEAGDKQQVAMSGEEVYQSACVVCHGAGVAGAPKLDDAAAWEPRLAQGIEVLYEHAIGGINAMPAKGGNTSLSDEAVKAAVDYMLGRESSGDGGSEQGNSGDGGETDGQAETDTGSTDDSAAQTAQAAGTSGDTAIDLAQGEDVYNKSCAVCHAAGVAGAPKPDDPAAWEARLAQGKQTLYDHALKGFNAMPAKGGNASLSDQEVINSVEFMLVKVQ